MATRAATAARGGQERGFFVPAAIALTLVNLIGFAPTWYLAPIIGGKSLPLVVHFHGAMATFWQLFFLTQVVLIAQHRPDLHRKLGQAGVLVAALAIGTALMVSIRAFHQPRAVAAGLAPHPLLMIQLVTIVSFIVFVWLGLRARRDAAAHKRLMFLATVTIAMPALARIARNLHAPFLPPNAFGGMVLADVFLGALVLHDIRSKGALHPVTIWAGSAFLVAQPLRYIVGTSDWWRSVANAVF